MIETKEDGVKKLGDAFDEFQQAAYCTNMMCMKGHDFINADLAINDHVTYLYEKLVRVAERQWDNGMNLFDSYIREIKEGTMDVVESIEGLKALMDHPDTLSNIATTAVGVVQIVGGAGLVMGGAPTIGMGVGALAVNVGRATAMHGVNNVYEGIVGLYAAFVEDKTINTNGPVRLVYMNALELMGYPEEYGSIAYSSTDSLLSVVAIGGNLHLIRILPDGTRNLILYRVSRFDFQRGYRLMKPIDVGIETTGAALNVRRTIQDINSSLKKMEK